MFVYLSKRIAIPNGTVITSLGWNEEQGWLASGGAGGLLKVLKVDGGLQGQKSGGLSLNQTLEGHESAVTIVAWNQQYRKLTSSDETGRIIVWTLHKGMWFEEMVNNRNKSRVVDLAWSVDGTKVCIAYEDGAVIVGSVDGSRLWGCDFDYELAKVCWSADDRYIIFGTSKGQVYVHDATAGQFVSQVHIFCEDGEAALAGLAWHPAWVDRPEPLPTFAICYTSGKVQLMDSIGDEKPCVFDCGVAVQNIAWNPQGTVLALAGLSSGATAESSVVITQFFSNAGMHLRTLRVAGKHCGGITWEGDGLRVALAVDSSVYFANVRPQYRYCYFKKTLVFAYNRPDKVEESVTFWNIKSNERVTKSVRGLLHLNACKDACLMVSRPSRDASLLAGSQAAQQQQQQSMVQLLNAIGSPIETRFITIEPYVCDMNSSHAVCCGEENVYIWQFRNPGVVVDALDPVSVQVSRSESCERIVHVDDIVRADSEPTMTVRSALTNDLICAVCMSEQYLFVAKESGLVHVYLLDPLQLVGKLLLPSRAHSMRVNCNSTSLAVIDLGGVMRVFSVEKEHFSLVARKAELCGSFERKDVWDMRWAADNPALLAVMEKTRMYIFRNAVPEEPVQSYANFCKFRSLKVRSMSFDELMLDPERPRKECVVDYETRELRDMRDVMNNATLKDAFAYVEDHPHEKLWSILAERALMQLDFAYAEIAFIRCKDYPAIQFIKRVRGLDDARKQAAEVNAYYGRFDEAERIYKEMDRKDLALALRHRLGDWFGVVRLVQEGGGDETLMLQAWENIGDHYADRQKWTKASQYYTQCRNYRKLAGVFYAVEDFEMLAQLITMAEHDKELLLTLGRMFLTVGLAEEAARAFLAAGEVRLAIDGCVELNMWDRAIALAQEHNTQNVEQLLHKYSSYLLQRDRLPEVIELYCKAGQHDEAAKLLAQLGRRAAATDVLKAKKFYVLSALEVEKYRKKKIALSKDGAAVVDDLLHADRSAVSQYTLDSAWRGAEAYHFYLMCQQQIRDKNLNAALVLAMRLMTYDDLIAPVDSYSLIALTAYLAGNFGVCSTAFTRLETAERNDAADGAGESTTRSLQLSGFTLDLDVTQKSMASATQRVMATGGGSALDGTTTSVQLVQRPGPATRADEFSYATVNLTEPPRRFANLAVQIFTRHRPVDNAVESVLCPKCGTFNKEWALHCRQCQQGFGVCIVTGRCIVAEEEAWQCTVCHHLALEGEVERFKNCPLCHSQKKQRVRRGL